jgi:hypothetical protein
MSAFIEREVERYLRTGEHDELSPDWPGSNFLERARYSDTALREALIAVVRQRTAHAVAPAELAGLELVGFTRAKVAPMVNGLFPAREVQTVLDVLARSVVFLTPATIEQVLREMPWLGTAWDLANLYLVSCGAAALSKSARLLVGLCEETTCFVTSQYFGAQDRFDDFVVHEAAHIFHNCKRSTIGLSGTARREWLLEIAYPKRETFAYSCETYSRILELGKGTAARRDSLKQVEAGPMPPDDRVDPQEYLDILREAVEPGNGWKRILRRCAAQKVQRRRMIGGP